MKLDLAEGKFIKQCMVGNGGKTERVCSKKEPCPKKAKYNFEDENGYVVPRTGLEDMDLSLNFQNRPRGAIIFTRLP